MEVFGFIYIPLFALSVIGVFIGLAYLFYRKFLDQNKRIEKFFFIISSIVGSTLIVITFVMFVMIWPTDMRDFLFMVAPFVMSSVVLFAVIKMSFEKKKSG